MIDSLRVLRSLKKKGDGTKMPTCGRREKEKKTFFPSPFARSSMFVPKKEEEKGCSLRSHVWMEEIRGWQQPPSLSNSKIHGENRKENTGNVDDIGVPVEKGEKFR